jgi:hypothetical protein
LTAVFQRPEQLSEFLTQHPHAFPVDAVTGSRAIDGSGNKVSIFEHFQVLGYRGLGQGNNLNHFTALAAATARKCLQDRQPGRVRQGLASGGKGFELG